MSSDHFELSNEKVCKAVSAVITSAENKRKKDVLADDEENFQVQICLKKIPPKNKTSKIDLPCSILKPNLEVCIFVKDLDEKDRDYEPTVEHFRELFSKKGVSSISEIVPLKSLRLEYQPYEAKRNLSNSYDIFLTDERIVKFLPRLLGKHFYCEKKKPTQVNLRAMDLQKEIQRATNLCQCTISSKGSTSMVTVGHSGMSQADITSNIVAFGQQLPNCVPGGLENVKQLLLKTRSSLSIPIYMSTGGTNTVVIPKEQELVEENEAEEITTVIGAKVKVYRDGKILLIKDGETEADALKRAASKFASAKKNKRPKFSKKGKGVVKKAKKSDEVKKKKK